MAKKKIRAKKGEGGGMSAGRITGYVYLLLMLGVFPLFYRNNYINIMESKWLFFMTVTLACAVALGICVLVDKIRKKPGENAAQKTAGALSLSTHEWFLLFFMGALFISWAGAGLTGYFVEAWDGSLGKLAGVFMYVVLFLSYVIVSRAGSFDTLVKQIYLWANFIVFSLAILNHFMVDPLGMYVNLDPEQYWMFCSTMGNINVLSGYFSVFVPITVALFMYVDSVDLLCLYTLIMVTSFMGVVAANGDAGIIGVLAGFVFLLWFAMKDLRLLSRYFTAAALFFTGAAIIGSMDASFREGVKEPLDTVPAFIAGSVFNRIALVICWGAVAALIIIRKKYKGSDPQKLLKRIRTIIFTLLGVVLAGGLLVFLYFSVIDRKTDLGGWDTYLRFSDLWGSSRGFTWKRTIILFREDYNLFQQIFGYGPDLMMVPYHAFFHEQIMEKMGAYLADAHSEVLQILGTVGISGVIGYFGFQIAALVRYIKHTQRNEMLVAVSAGCTAYMVQGLLCSPQTFSTPVMFIMLALGERLIREDG